MTLGKFGEIEELSGQNSDGSLVYSDNDLEIEDSECPYCKQEPITIIMQKDTFHKFSTQDGEVQQWVEIRVCKNGHAWNYLNGT